MTYVRNQNIFLSVFSPAVEKPIERKLIFTED